MPANRHLQTPKGVTVAYIREPREAGAEVDFSQADRVVTIAYSFVGDSEVRYGATIFRREKQPWNRHTRRAHWQTAMYCYEYFPVVTELPFALVDARRQLQGRPRPKTIMEKDSFRRASRELQTKIKAFIRSRFHKLGVRRVTREGRNRARADQRQRRITARNLQAPAPVQRPDTPVPPKPTKPTITLPVSVKSGRVSTMTQRFTPTPVSTKA